MTQAEAQQQSSWHSTAESLQQVAIIAGSGKTKYVQVDPGLAYQVALQKGARLVDADLSLIAKRIDYDLEVLLPDETKVVFNDYFEACTIGAGCVVSLPAAESSLYYVPIKNDEELATLPDGSKLIYFHGNRDAVIDIATAQDYDLVDVFKDIYRSDYQNMFATVPRRVSDVEVEAPREARFNARDFDAPREARFNARDFEAPREASANIPDGSFREFRDFRESSFDAPQKSSGFMGFVGNIGDSITDFDMPFFDMPDFGLADFEMPEFGLPDFITSMSNTTLYVLGGLLVAGVVAASSSDDASPSVPEASDPEEPTPEEPTPEPVIDVSGSVVAGAIIDGNDLVAKVYSASGDELGSSSVNGDGIYNISVSGYTSGAVSVEVASSAIGNDYIDEGTGQAVDLYMPLRAVASGLKTDQINVINVNPITELATRQLLTDDGNTTHKLSAQSAAEIDASMADVVQALGLDQGTNLTSIKAVSVNDAEFADSTAEQQAIAHVLAGISGMETSAKNTQTVLSELNQAINTDGTIDQGAVDDLIQGAVKSDTFNTHTDSSTAIENTIGTSITSVTNLRFEFDDDDQNFTTDVKTQTITLKLDNTLSSSQTLWGALTDATNKEWVDLSGYLSGTNMSWTDAQLTEGTSGLRFAITNDGVKPKDDLSNIVGNIVAQQYTLDTLPPNLLDNTLNAYENTLQIATLAANEAVTYSTTISGVDAEHFTLTSAGLLSFKTEKSFDTTDDDGTDGVYDINITMTDLLGNTTQDASVSVTLTLEGQAPSLTNENSDVTASLNSAFQLDVSRNFVGAVDATYSLSNQPSWMSINASTGLISGTPTSIAALTEFTVTVTNSEGSASDTIGVSVVETSGVAHITNLDVTSNIVIDLGSHISSKSDTGFITIHDSENGWTIQNDANQSGATEAINNTQVISIASEAITINGNMLILNVNHEDIDVLDFASSYYITMDEGIVNHTDGSISQEIDNGDQNSISFKTVEPVKSTTGASSVAFNDAGSLITGLIYHDAHWSDANSIWEIIDFSNGDHAAVVATTDANGYVGAIASGNINIVGFSEGDVLYLDNFGNNDSALLDGTDTSKWVTEEGHAAYQLSVDGNSALTVGFSEITDMAIVNDGHFESVIEGLDAVIYA